MSAIHPEENLAHLKIDGATAVPKQNGSTGPNVTSGDLENGDSDDDEANEDDGAQVNGTAEGAAKKKKKRKPRKKKKAGASLKGQSVPPRVKVSDLFPNDTFPVGEEVDYKGENAYRTTSEEKRHLDRMNQDMVTDFRHAAEVHREVRKYAKSVIKPGMGLTEIAELIENGTRHLTGHMGLEEGDNIIGGVAFQPD